MISNEKEDLAMNAPESPDEILIRAAEAAIRILPGIEKNAENHLAEANRLQVKASQLKALISAAGLRFDGPVAAPLRQEDLPLGTKPMRGQIKNYIDDILVSKPGITEGEIRAEMLQRFNVACGRSTLYSNLANGKETGRYRVEDSKWFLR